MDFMAPLLGADGIAMQGIDHRVAPRFVLGVTGRQEDKHVAVHRIALQIAFQSRAVNLDVLHRYRLGVRDYRRHDRLNLSGNRGNQGERQAQ